MIFVLFLERHQNITEKTEQRGKTIPGKEEKLEDMQEMQEDQDFESIFP